MVAPGVRLSMSPRSESGDGYTIILPWVTLMCLPTADGQELPHVFKIESRAVRSNGSGSRDGIPSDPVRQSPRPYATLWKLIPQVDVRCPAHRRGKAAYCLLAPLGGYISVAYCLHRDSSLSGPTSVISEKVL
ncbi:hypothetical protein J6590_017224 [Homalodisca vitripennis]|nr:hypothetical protein J6590_017224 [Homalodisca vitripennis]